jgi:hypothetical protein
MITAMRWAVRSYLERQTEKRTNLTRLDYDSCSLVSCDTRTEQPPGSRKKRKESVEPGQLSRTEIVKRRTHDERSQFRAPSSFDSFIVVL